MARDQLKEITLLNYQVKRKRALRSQSWNSTIVIPDLKIAESLVHILETLQISIIDDNSTKEPNQEILLEESIHHQVTNLQESLKMFDPKEQRKEPVLMT